MAYAMTKQGSLDNCITYEFICDTVADMNAIENTYRTIGTVAIVLSGESSGLEVYIAGSDKQWNSLSSIGASGSDSTGGLSIYICTQDEVDQGLPDIDEPDESTIYLVPSGNNSGNLYEEYIYVDDAWEKFGSAGIDLSNYVQKTDIATQSTAGLVKVLDNGNVTFNESNQLVLTLAGTAVVKSGQSDHPISVTHQHEAAFYGLAKAAGQDMKNSNNAVGTYTTEAATAIRNMVGAGTYTKPSGGIPAEDLASGVIPNIGPLAPKDSPKFTGSISLGRKDNSITGDKSVAVGNRVIAAGIASFAEGQDTAASVDASHAEGMYTVASGVSSHAEGMETKASGQSSHAEGMGGTFTVNQVQQTSQAAGTADHVEGYQCLTASTQPGNHAEGYQTMATGGAAHTEGVSTVASGNSSHAEGNGTVASAYTAHAEGQSTQASGNSSHAEGQWTQATDAMSHAEGYYTIASGVYTHAEGWGTTAKGWASHVGGKYNVVDTYLSWPEWTANTEYIIGDKVKVTTTSDNVTTVTGYICTVANTDSSWISSKWEKDNYINYATIIGNGTENARSNAYALEWNGTGHFAGDVYVGCNNDSTGGNKVATEAFVTTRVPAPPVADGTYTLQCVVSSGTATYSWVSLPNGEGVSF